MNTANTLAEQMAEDLDILEGLQVEYRKKTLAVKEQLLALKEAFVETQDEELLIECQRVHDEHARLTKFVVEFGMKIQSQYNV